MSMDTRTRPQGGGTVNTQATKIIESRLGPREIRLDKVIRFPRGIIGFEHLRDFTLLQIAEGTALLVLQSMEDPTLGLLVADPYSFVSDFSLRVSDAEQFLLKARSAQDLAVLVTVSIPPGKPEETALNLLGPILVNHRERVGLQVPQAEYNGPSKFYIKEKVGAPKE